AELAVTKQQLREGGARMRFEELGLQTGEIKTAGFIAFEAEAQKLNTILQEIDTELGPLRITSKKVGLEFHVQQHSPQTCGILKGISWNEVYARHDPLRDQWQACYQIYKTQLIRYQPAYDMGPAAQVSQLSVILNWVRASQRLIVLEVQQGNLEQALEYLVKVKKVHKQLAGERPYNLIEGLVEITVDGIILAAERQILESPNLNLKTWTSLYELLDHPNALRLLSQSMEGDRIVFTEYIWEQISRSQTQRTQLIAQLGYLDSTGKLSSYILNEHVYAAIYYTLFKDYDHSYYVKSLWTIESMAIATIEGKEPIISQMKQDMDQILLIEKPQNLLDQIKYTFSSLSLPGVELVIRKMVCIETYQRQLHIAMLLKQYHFENKRYPEHLYDIPTIGELNLSDPITLEPMQYRLEQDGSYTLYSVGMNGLDDAAVHLPLGEKNQDGIRIKDDTAPDWIWPKMVTD
ncbi:MAG: hypothetical protein AAF571_15260, partial [Verrucomicrobiota bacterium]